MYKILFICTGNICRSPTAEGVFRSCLEALGLSEFISVDSAGTHNYHAGEPPDPRAIAAAAKRGISIEHLKARKLAMNDFKQCDLILALDGGHLEYMRRMSPKPARARLALLLEYSGFGKEDVPDPYYGNAQDFEHVLDLLEKSADTLIPKLSTELKHAS